ncbi:MAG: two-component system response regulator [Planctomycetales bacterium]
MPKQVLDVGQCRPDHAAIRRLLESRFACRVTQADHLEGALRQLRGTAFDLVLINRLLDGDGSDGLEVLRAIKADPALASVSVMLVTNYPEYQEQAVADGALPGFGKAALNAPETIQRLAAILH